MAHQIYENTLNDELGLSTVNYNSLQTVNYISQFVNYCNSFYP